MLGQSIWWSGIALEALLVLRGLLGKWAWRFPVFYGYLSFVLFQSLVRFSTNLLYPRRYIYVYWITEFMGVLIGCGVVFEIYRVGLAAFPGTARMVRNLLAVIFVLAFTKALVNASNAPMWWPVATTLDLEKYLRVIQAFSIAALVSLFLFYSIPFGKNLRGILAGYSLFIAATIVWLTTASSTSNSAPGTWSYVLPVAYLAALGMWTGYLWSYQPQPQPQAAKLEDDYQKIAAATRRRLQEARGYLGKATPL
jgi:hypothetical protein